MTDSGRSRGTKSGGEWGAYRQSGVDIDAGERAVELMWASVDATRRPEVIGGLGGFASAMALPPGMRALLPRLRGHGPHQP
jgi:phosphoribosylaminoimidazole (AIR) synthetase